MPVIPTLGEAETGRLPQVQGHMSCIKKFQKQPDPHGAPNHHQHHQTPLFKTGAPTACSEFSGSARESSHLHNVKNGYRKAEPKLSQQCTIYYQSLPSQASLVTELM